MCLGKVLPIGLISLLLVSGGCNDRPSDVLSEDEMISLLADMQLAEAYRQIAGPELPESLRKALPEGVLATHGVSYDQLNKTLQYYGRNTDDYFELLNKVNARLAEKRKKIDGNSLDVDMTANNLWPYQAMSFFNPEGATDGLVFELPGDQLEKGDRLEWRLRLSTVTMAEGVLGVDYSDGTSTFSRRSAAGKRTFNITLQTDTNRTVKRLFGMLSVPRESMPLWADSISIIHLPYDSVSYNSVYQQTRYYGPIKRKTVVQPQDSDSVPRQTERIHKLRTVHTQR